MFFHIFPLALLFDCLPAPKYIYIFGPTISEGYIAFYGMCHNAVTKYHERQLRKLKPSFRSPEDRSAGNSKTNSVVHEGRGAPVLYVSPDITDTGRN